MYNTICVGLLYFTCYIYILYYVCLQCIYLTMSHLYFTLVVAFAGLRLQLHTVQFCSQSFHGLFLVLQLGPFLLALSNHT